MPVQIAKVQVSTELLEVSGMDSKDSFPKMVLPLVCGRLPKELACRRSPAAGPQGHCGDGLSVNFNFFKSNAFTFPKEGLK